MPPCCATPIGRPSTKPKPPYAIWPSSRPDALTATVLHLFKFFAARDDSAVTLAPEGRQILAKWVSAGNGVKDRRAPERGGRTGAECFFRPVPGLADLLYGPRAHALGYSLAPSGLREHFFGCGYAALWGGQSWPQPPFRRLLRAARESPTESRTPRTPAPDPSGRLPYEKSLPLPPRPQSPPARPPPPATHTPTQSCFLPGESPPPAVPPHRRPPSPRAARCATALRGTIRAGRASGPRRPVRPCATWRASASSDGCHRARTTRGPAAAPPAGSPHPPSQAAADRAASRRRPT